MEIEHKCDNFVPILIAPDIQEAIELLIAKRGECEIGEDNPYVFAASRGSCNAIRGSEVLRSYKQTVDIEKPEGITATSLRKHAATVTQVLDMTENDQDDLANYLGHDIRVHRRNYRLNEAATKVVKMGKLLTVLETGNLKEYKGKSLRDISLRTSAGMGFFLKHKCWTADYNNYCIGHIFQSSSETSF